MTDGLRRVEEAFGYVIAGIMNPRGGGLVVKTDAEIRYEGIRALVSSLGDVNAERFIALISREPFDYTKWQRDLWAGKSIEEISKEATLCKEQQSE